MKPFEFEYNLIFMKFNFKIVSVQRNKAFSNAMIFDPLKLSNLYSLKQLTCLAFKQFKCVW